MDPVLVLQFMADDAPAYLGTWLQQRRVPVDVRVAGRAPAFPPRIEGYRALALLGGSMSVNDELPYLRTAEHLIRQAMAGDVPVLGHCLGGQLMARALGARVGPSPAPEVGWHRVDSVDSGARREWLGDAPFHHVFHWHYEAFDLPPGVEPLARSPNCPHQAFAVGPHLALQWHVEVDAEKIDLWLSQGDEQYLQAQQRHASVHGESRIRGDTAEHLQAQQRLADRLYDRWLRSAR